MAIVASVAMLQAQTTCTAPTHLTATPHVPDYRNVTLRWTPVADPMSSTVSLVSPMALSAKIGWGGGSAANVVAATRFLPGDLAASHGKQLTAVTFAPGVSQSFATFDIVIWQGGSMNPLDNTFSPGNLIYNQPVNTTLTVGALDTVPLSAPILIDSTQELWVGVHIVALYGCPLYASASDSSLHNQNLVGSGNFSSWAALNVSGAEYSWCIGMVVTSNPNLAQGYNIYRDNTLLTTTTAREYVDTLASNGIFQYDITAHYVGGCESSAITATVDMDDDTCFIFDLPFTENFDSYPGSTSGTTNNLPECYHHICGTYSSYAGYPIIYSSSTYSHSGNNSLRFFTTTSSTDYGHQVAILPPIDVMTYPMSTLQIEFDGRASATTSNFNVVVGVMDNYSDLSTFVPIDTFTSNSTTYTNFTANFSHYTGNGSYIALMAPRDFANNYGYVDNIRVEEIPSCPKPRDLTSILNNTTTSSVTLTWNEMGNASEWEVEYGPTGFILGTGTRTSAYSNTTTIGGLSASVGYDFYVRSVCGPDDSSAFVGPYSQMTECGSISELPYTQNFDLYTGTTATSGMSNLFQFCWSNLNSGTTYPNYPIAYSTSTYAYSQPNSLRFYTYNTTAYGDQYAIMPGIDPSIQISSLMLEYKARRYSTSYPFHVIIGVMSDSTDATTFEPVDTLLIPTTESLDYRDYMTLFDQYTGTGRYIAFKGVKPASSYNAGNIDDVVLSYIPTCMHPVNLTVSAVTDESVTVEWHTLGSETSWEVVVVPKGTPTANGTPQTTSEHPFTLYMLSPQTDYDVYVRSICGGADYSVWAGPVTFKTRCAATNTIPYVESFDSYGTATSTSSTSPGPMPTCWDRITNYTSPYPYISSSQHSSGAGALYFYSTSAYYAMAVSQQLDISSYSANELYLSFKLYKTSSTYGRMQVGVMTNPDSMETFVLLKDIYSYDIPNVSTWTEFNVNLPGPFSTPVYLAFRAPAEGTSYVFLDDVVIDEIPTCSEPRFLSVGQLQGTSAMLTWEPALFGDPVYVVQYSEAGMDSWSSPVQVAGTRHMLSGLTPYTLYEVRVYSDCSDEVSDTVSITFRTPCLSGGEIRFDEGTTTTYQIPLNNLYRYTYTQQIFLSSEMNGVTDIQSVSFDYAYSTAMTVKTNVNIYLGHTNKSTFSGTSDYVPLSDLKLVYSGHLNCSQGWNTFLLDSIFHYNGSDNLVLAVDDNSNAYNSSAYVFRYQSQSPDYRTLYYYSDSNNPDPANPTAAGASSARSYNRSNVIFGSDCDSVWVCARPNVYIRSVSSSAVTLDWAAGDSESSWAVEYRSEDDNDWNSEGAVYTNTYTFDNLNSGKHYDFRVCALCSPTDSSLWVTVSAFTPCEAIQTLPYTQDFESATGSGSTQSIDLCLTRGTNYTTAYPYPSSTYAASGLYSLYFYGASSTYSYLALPELDASIPMDSLWIRFHALKTSANYFIQVGIMDDPDDITTFTLLESFSPSQNSTTSNPCWEMGDVYTHSYTGNGRYVAFRAPQSATSTYIYLDSITVDYMPSCLHVSNLHLDSVTASTAGVSWTAGQDEQSWVYVYGKKDSVDLTTATYMPVTSNSLLLTGLESNTSYDVYVAADCNEPEPSLFMKITFRTDCDPITSVPYFENFDEYGGVSGNAYFPYCWYRHNTYSTTSQYPYLSTTSSSAPQSLYFYSSTATYSMAITNEIDPVININTLQARFKMRTGTSTTSTYYMIVGMVTDPENPATFTPVDTVICSNTGVFEDMVVSFAGYTGAGRHIAFKGYGTHYLDDVWIEEAPQCDAPENLVVSGVTNHAATLSWDEGGNETEWQVYVFPEGANLASATPYPVQNNPTLTLSGLEVGTRYNVYVRAVCPSGTGYSSYVVSEFTTQCDPIGILPFTENFDSYVGTTSTTIGNNLPVCWNYLNAGTSYSGYPVIYSSSTYAESGSNSLKFYVSTASTYAEQYVILPQFDNSSYPLGDLQLLFDARRVSASNPFTMIVGVMSDPTDATTFDVIDTVEVGSTTYEPYGVYFHNYTGNGNLIAIKTPMLAVLNYGHIDNIEVSVAPSCLPVGHLRFENITTNMVDVVWRPNGGEYQWTVQYRELNGADSLWLESPASGMPRAQLSNLSSNTTYEVRVQANCGAGDLSTYTTIYQFTTECVGMDTLPYVMNFDSYTGFTTTTASTNNLPPCWHNISLSTNSSYTGYPIIYNSSTYAASGTNSLRFYTGTTSGYGDEIAILPVLDATTNPVNTLQLAFDVRKNSTSYATFTLEVGVMTDPYDAGTFMAIDTVVVSETTYVSHTTFFNNYTGSGSYIALKAPNQAGVSYNTGYVDNLELSLMPLCRPVRNVSVSNITATGADVAWVSNGSEGAWWVRYKADTTGAAYDSAHVTATPSFTLLNLTPNTTYTVEVKADCGGGEESVYSSPVTFTTECLPITTLPYNENFSNYTHTTNSTTVPNLSNCWDPAISGGTSYTAYPYVYYGSTYAQSAPYSLRFYAFYTSAYGDQYAILPAVDVTVIPINTVQISFGARKYSTSYPFNPVVGVMQGTDISTFEPLDTVEVTATTYSTFTVKLNGYTGSGNRIAIVSFKPTTSYAAGYIDDVVLDFIPCTPPESLTVVTYTSHTADLSWTPVGVEAAWNLQCKASTDTGWTLVSNLSSPSYTLTNLQPNTSYQVRVQAACAGEESGWTPAVTFTTMDDQCTAPTDLHLVDTTTTTAILDWSQAAGTADTWTVYYRRAGEDAWSMQAASTHPYELYGLEEGTTYTAQVTATCANGVTSDPCDPITFTTSTVGVRDYAWDHTEVYPNPTTGKFSIENSELRMENVEVYDVCGKMIYSVEVNGHTVQIDATRFASGVYFTRITTDKGTVTKRIVKK